MYGREAEINGPLSSSWRRCIVLQQTLVAMVSCISVMKSGPGEGYQPLKEREQPQQRRAWIIDLCSGASEDLEQIL